MYVYTVVVNCTLPRNPCVYVCACVFIKLHITAQSGPFILLIVTLCQKGTHSTVLTQALSAIALPLPASFLISKSSGLTSTEPTLSCLRYFLLPPKPPPFPTSRLSLFWSFLRLFPTPPSRPWALVLRGMMRRSRWGTGSSCGWDCWLLLIVGVTPSLSTHLYYLYYHFVGSQGLSPLHPPSSSLLLCPSLLPFSPPFLSSFSLPFLSSSPPPVPASVPASVPVPVVADSSLSSLLIVYRVFPSIVRRRAGTDNLASGSCWLPAGPTSFLPRDDAAFGMAMRPVFYTVCVFSSHSFWTSQGYN